MLAFLPAGRSPSALPSARLAIQPVQKPNRQSRTLLRAVLEVSSGALDHLTVCWRPTALFPCLETWCMHSPDFEHLFDVPYAASLPRSQQDFRCRSHRFCQGGGERGLGTWCQGLSGRQQRDGDWQAGDARRSKGTWPYGASLSFLYTAVWHMWTTCV